MANTRTATTRTEADNAELREALSHIKRYIGEDDIQQNRDLHRAVQLIVDVARRHNLLAERN